MADRAGSGNVGEAAAGAQRRPGAVALASVLALGMAVAAAMQFVLGVLGPHLTAEFGLTRTQLGLLTSGLFVVAAVISPSVGRLVDRVSVSAMLRILFFLAAGALAALALAPTYALLLVATGLAGLAQAFGNPVTNKAVAMGAAPQHQGVIMGVKQSGVQMSAFLVGAVLPMVAATAGWRTGVLLVAGGSLLCGVLAPPLLRTAARETAGSRRADAQGGRSRRLGEVVPWLAVYAFLMGGGFSATNVYLALYAFEELAFSAALAGSLIAIVGAIGIGARILWGVLSPRARYVGTPLALLAIGALIAQLGILGAMFLHAATLWIGVVVFGASAAAWNSVAMYALVRELAAADAGRASGWYHVGFFSGFMVVPVAFGWIVDSTQSYTTGWLLSCGLFLVAALVAWSWRQRQAAQEGRTG